MAARVSAWDQRRARANLAKAGPVGRHQVPDNRSLRPAPANPPNELLGDPGLEILADPELLRRYVLRRLNRVFDEVQERGNVPLLLEILRLAAILSPISTAPPNAQRLDA